jgi:transcriptional regulator with XRE-family HTH domain
MPAKSRENVKMKKHSEIAKRVTALKIYRGETQARFAATLEVTQPMVSAWEGGSDAPSPAFCVRLGNLAPYPDNIWFWEQAGIDGKKMLSATQARLRELSAPPAEGKIIPVSYVRIVGQKLEETGRYRDFPAELAPNPLSTRCLVIDETLAGKSFSPGDTVVMEEPLGDPYSAGQFINQLIFAELDPGIPENPGMAQWWIKGLQVGRLRYKYHQSFGTFRWIAALGPLLDSGSEDLQHGSEFPLGYMDFPVENKGAYPRRNEVEETAKRTKEQAVAQIRLAPGCRVIGKIIAWFPSCLAKTNG